MVQAIRAALLGTLTGLLMNKAGRTNRARLSSPYFLLYFDQYSPSSMIL